ncbi:PqqD family protein [bacterium]|nr:PqqD family protein [bacterium]
MEQFCIDSERVTASILDDEAVLVNIDTTHYYNLNASATVVWKLLQEGPATLEQAVQSVSQAYHIPESSIAKDIERLLQELVSEGLIILRR